MANIEHFIPHIIKWEAGVTAKGLTNEQLFEKARAKGYSNKKSDRGGATMVGVTIATYTAYRRKFGIKVTSVEDLKKIDYRTWRNILKTMFWDKWKADNINNQSMAELVVDWVWGSGLWGIKNPQQCLGVTDDGVVGSQTITAINSCNQSAMYRRIWKRRRDYYYGIVARDSGQRVNLQGWLNRLNDQHYED